MQAKQIELKIRVPSGISDDWPDFHDLVDNTIRGKGGHLLKAVAQATYIEPHLLGRMLNRNPDDMRHLPLSALPTIIETTGDLRPVLWLVEKFFTDGRQADLGKIKDMVAKLNRLIADAEANG